MQCDCCGRDRQSQPVHGRRASHNICADCIEEMLPQHMKGNCQDCDCEVPEGSVECPVCNPILEQLGKAI